MHAGPAPGAPYGHPGQSHPAHHAGYYQTAPPYGGPVYYPNHGGDVNGQHTAAFDYRRRGYDALNDFFGDAKRRQIDPTSYAQVGQRLIALQGLPLQGGGIADYMPAGPQMIAVDGHGGHGGPIPQHQYALPPMPNLRTKNDLMNIDQFLEQMQSTVYESSNAAAAAGLQQPGAHYTHQALGFRTSHSPPQSLNNLGPQSAHAVAAHAQAMATSHSQTSGTPALSPPSSAVSYTSGQSPTSSHGMSPTSRHSTAAYPSLPAVTVGYSPHSTTAPASTLGTNFDSDPRRRYSGGMLQRSAKGPTDAMEMSDDSATPSPKMAAPAIIKTRHSSSSNIDPALSGVSSPGERSESGDSARDRAEEAWIENIRVIEALRNMVQELLKTGKYEADADADTPMSTAGSDDTVVLKDDKESLYPTLRTDEE